MENISSLVPRSDAEIAILKELEMVGGDADTSYIVSHAMERFPVLQMPKEQDRKTPSGHPWWPGRFRFDLTNLKKKDEVVSIRRGVLRITDKGRERIKHTGGTKLSEISQPKITVIGFGLDACLTITHIALKDELDIKIGAVDTQIEIDRITGEKRAWHSKGFFIGVATSEGLVFARTLRREKIDKLTRGSDLVFLIGDMRDSEVLDSVPKVSAIMGSFEALTIGIFRPPDASVDTDHLRVMDECMQDLTGTLDAWMTVPYNMS